MPDLPAPRYTLWQAIGVALSLAQRALDEVRAFVKDGGKPGPAGLGWDDMTIEYDGARRVTLRFARGQQVYEKTICFPAMIYRGFHEEGELYEHGDVVTWGGAVRHCNEATR